MANTFLMAERDRWPLWLAVALGAGSAGYFALPVEPPMVLSWAALGLGLGAAAARIKWHWRLGLLAAPLVGFGLAKLREEAVATSVLDHAVVAHLTGRIASLALAAAILLVLRPEAIAEPGFQMSFAAVAGLVAVAEWEMRRQRATPHGALYRYAHGIAMTSLVGSLATLPFALFHFERATHYAVLGNLIAMPVMGFWVMPAAALSVALMPLGLEGWPLHLLGQGISVMVVAMGRWVSGLPGAVSLAPAMPLSALVLISLGGLWLFLWRTRWRWWGVAPIAAGVALVWFAPLPDMLAASDGATVAVRAADGKLHFLRKPRDKYVARDWLRRDGDVRDVADAVGLPGLKCDGLGCVVTGKTVIAASLRPEAFLEDCIRAQVVVSTATMNCKGPALVIDGKAAAGGQGWRITLSPTPSAVSVRSYRGMRPWAVNLL